MNSAETTQVAVILLTMDQRAKTLRCLASFRVVNDPPHRIIVFDNGSQDGTADAIREGFPEVLVHYHPFNLGVAGGRNAAAELAIEQFQPSFLFFLDNDMTVTTDFLSRLVEPFESDPALAQTTGKIMCHGEDHRLYGAGGCCINFLLGQTSHIGHGEPDIGQYDQPQKCIPSGGCMLVRTDIWKQLAGFDPVYNPYGPEDLDFGLRVREAGYYARYVPQSVVFHDPTPGRTLTGPDYSEHYAQTKARMWFVFMRRRASLSQWCGFLFFGLPFIALRVLVREGMKGNFGAVKGLIRGSLDFLRSPRNTGEQSQQQDPAVSRPAKSIHVDNTDRL